MSSLWRFYIKWIFVLGSWKRGLLLLLHASTCYSTTSWNPSPGRPGLDCAAFHGEPGLYIETPNSKIVPWLHLLYATNCSWACCLFVICGDGLKAEGRFCCSECVCVWQILLHYYIWARTKLYPATTFCEEASCVLFITRVAVVWWLGKLVCNWRVADLNPRPDILGWGALGQDRHPGLWFTGLWWWVTCRG